MLVLEQKWGSIWWIASVLEEAAKLGILGAFQRLRVVRGPKIVEVSYFTTGPVRDSPKQILDMSQEKKHTQVFKSERWHQRCEFVYLDKDE